MRSNPERRLVQADIVVGARCAGATGPVSQHRFNLGELDPRDFAQTCQFVASDTRLSTLQQAERDRALLDRLGMRVQVSNRPPTKARQMDERVAV